MESRRTLILIAYVITAAVISWLIPPYMGLLFFGFFILKGWLEYKSQHVPGSIEDIPEQ
ncbi:MAG: hypothetical protein IKE12_07615 [Erysipelotrichaceae bacterium]|nr:hypothetical protein [Erysipelotrichaceae bacterium]MBR6957386.1 hypothetical protein [Erysipelotrichaceae bacterium]